MSSWLWLIWASTSTGEWRQTLVKSFCWFTLLRYNNNTAQKTTYKHIIQNVHDDFCLLCGWKLMDGKYRTNFFGISSVFLSSWIWKKESLKRSTFLIRESDESDFLFETLWRLENPQTKKVKTCMYCLEIKYNEGRPRCSFSGIPRLIYNHMYTNQIKKKKTITTAYCNPSYLKG